MLIWFVHRVLNGNPTDPLEPTHAIFGYRCFDNWKVSAIDQFVKIKVPPSPVIECFFGSWVDAFDFVVIPLICAVTGHASELA